MYSKTIYIILLSLYYDFFLHYYENTITTQPSLFAPGVKKKQ